MRILLPVDGSAYTTRMLDYVAGHTSLLGAKPLITVLCVQPAVSPREAAYEGREKVEARYRRDAEPVFGLVRDALGPLGASLHEDVAFGDPGTEIARYAREHGIDLIIMGSHGHGALAGLLVGSVTNAVLTHSVVPVLIVR